ncbi:acyclic terpene utilization AtuA family protein [Gordonia sp. DT219]|uniref:acyclic terpene utilization AtuA family protein n=1 Tax=Gordonia sp. DT219 TaxID=3416658 RepID=UPI003CF19FD5
MSMSLPPIARIMVPAGMLGTGFPAETLDRGIDLGVDAIAIDAGSTDPGAYYLGTATAKPTAAAVRRDLRLLLNASSRAGVPLIVGSCGTAGTDAGVDWVAGIARDILTQDGLSLRLARIYSEQKPSALVSALADGDIAPLPGGGPLDQDLLLECEHIVGLMGHEPLSDALDRGADVVLAGRTTDTAVIAAAMLRKGAPEGPTWHAAKIAECGGMSTTNPVAGGVHITLDAGGFTIEPLAATAACTPRSVAAHMLYENVDPFLLREPAGTLDTTAATYTALDDRRVRVEGSVFHHEPHTVKLEGAALRGYETMSLVGLRDPVILDRFDEWLAFLRVQLDVRIADLLADEAVGVTYDLRPYGYNAVLGDIEPDASPPREVGLVMLVRAGDQETATAVAKIASPLLLHLPLPDMDRLPSFAFPYSPAEIERGPAYEFVLQHVLSVDSANAAFRTEFDGNLHHDGSHHA